MEETKPSICDPTLKDKINYRPAPLFAPDLKKLPYKCEGPVMEAFESERFRIKFKAIK